MLVSDVEVLERSGCASVESAILKRRLRWCGQVLRMADNRTLKQLLFGELAVGKRPPHKPKMRYKDCIKRTLKQCNMPMNEWETMTKDREIWRAAVRLGTSSFEHNRTAHLILKKEGRKGSYSDMSVGLMPQNRCQHCRRTCRSRAGLKSHERSCAQMPFVCNDASVLRTCRICGEGCITHSDMKEHMRKHIFSNTRGMYVCPLCNKYSRSAAGMNSRMRSSHEVFIK